MGWRGACAAPAATSTAAPAALFGGPLLGAFAQPWQRSLLRALGRAAAGAEDTGMAETAFSALSQAEPAEPAAAAPLAASPSSRTRR